MSVVSSFEIKFIPRTTNTNYASSMQSVSRCQARTVKRAFFLFVASLSPLV